MKSIRKVAWVDVSLFLGIVLLIYCVIGAVHQWASPYRPKTEIDLSAGSLFIYSVFSIFRVVAAYLLSVVFTLIYGYAAAKSRWGEAVLIPLLDILQSVPVLGFMPGLVLALVNLFPNSNMGLELAAVVMIFTGQGWNMVFSFYSSLKSVPVELKEMSSLFRLNRFDTLRTLEIPYAMNGLLWNSMLSMAGGWFFLMVIESFSLGDKDFRLPGIGSYMAVAYEQGNVGAILAGIFTMFFLIFLVDRCVWAPLVVWSDRFKFGESSFEVKPSSFVLDWLKRSDLLGSFFEWREKLYDKLLKKWNTFQADRKSTFTMKDETLKRTMKIGRAVVIGVGVLGILFGVKSMYTLVGRTSFADWMGYCLDTFYTFLRVIFAVLLGSLWAIPVGVFIGSNPKWTSRLQPLVQIVASFPAPMLFPMITFALIQAGISLEIGAVVLMIFASQWYILFNVIAGATRIPRSMMEMADVFQVKGFAYWKGIVLPCIYPSLVNGWITAAGGAWNACIVSEIVKIGSGEYYATGIGATITRAAQNGDYPTLSASILIMVTTVVLLNRFFWGGLYRLAETRYRIE